MQYCIRYSKGRGRMTAYAQTPDEAKELAKRFRKSGHTVSIVETDESDPVPAYNRLRDLRTKSGISLRQLAAEAGVPYQSIQRIELGTRSIESMSLKTAVSIARALGVYAEDLLDE